MKNVLHIPARTASMNNSAAIDLRLDLSNTPAVIVGVAMAPQTGETETKRQPPDSPRQPTMSLPSEAPVTESVTESTSDLSAKDASKPSVGSRARRGSATMKSFLQRVMRSQSDSHIRIAPIAPSTDARPDFPLDTVADTQTATMKSCGREEEREEQAATAEETGDEHGQHHIEDEMATTSMRLGETGLSEQVLLDDDNTHDSFQTRETNGGDDGLCDVFLNSSLQLLQVQSDAKQRVRQLWTCAQRLRWENQLSDAGIELLHQELLGVMKALTVEKLDGPRHVKAGYLTLVQAPPAVVAANIMQRGAAGATKSLLFGAGVKPASLDQRMWVNLSEEQCRMELIPSARSDERSPPPPQQQPAQPSSDGTSQPTAFGKFKLPTSISWLLSDPLQGQTKDEDTNWIGRTAIKLQGCQVRRLPDMAGTNDTPPRVRFQLLVPTNSDPSSVAPGATAATASASPSTCTPQTSTAVIPDQTVGAMATQGYGVYVFEVPTTADGPAAERDEWIRAIDRVCVFHLYALERQLRDACYMLKFRDILATSFPVCVPLTWLRNRLEKAAAMSSSNGGAMSAQQLANFQYQQLQRRSSRNLSMVQIVKDLERDRILVDKKLLISCAGSSKTPSAALPEGMAVVEHDSVAEIVKYLVGKAMAFARSSTPTTTRPGRTSSLGKPPMPTPPATDVKSPSSRLSKFTEARALAFVERVLRGSSRTQSGGDIYDAISFFCQQRNLTICPMSHDAHPVQLNVVEDRSDPSDEDCGGDGAFHIEIEVSMQFKVVEMPAMTPRFDDEDGVSDTMTAMASPREWAVLEGTLRRQFTLGKLSEPGSVTVKFIPDPESAEFQHPDVATPPDHE